MLNEKHGFMTCWLCNTDRPTPLMVAYQIKTQINDQPETCETRYQCADTMWCASHDTVELAPVAGIPRGPQLNSDLIGLAARENNTWPQPHGGSPTVIP